MITFTAAQIFAIWFCGYVAGFILAAILIRLSK